CRCSPGSSARWSTAGSGSGCASCCPARRWRRPGSGCAGCSTPASTPTPRGTGRRSPGRRSDPGRRSAAVETDVGLPNGPSLPKTEGTGVCTVIVGFAPDADVPVMLAGVRDEFLARPWLPPGRHWPDRPGLIGGLDRQAGGTWLAVDPAAPRAAALLNGRGVLARDEARRSRGELPLYAVTAGEPPAEPDL